MTNARTTEELQQIATYADELPVAIWVGEVPTGACVYVNSAFRKILGIDPPDDAARGNYVGPYSVHTHEGAPYPEDQMPFEQAVAARSLVEIDDMVIHRHDGGRTYLRVLARPLYDASGKISHVLEAFTDISPEVLSKRQEREHEAQLRQAQRMESLGSLAGGIAHDFNNLLTVIRMIASQLGTAAATSPEVHSALLEIDEVTESAARLTRALLGFARQGKNLRHRTCMNDLAARVAELSRRTVGRYITVASELSAGSLPVQGDPAQLEQLFMNLVVNARDAISGVGRLTIRTSSHDVPVDSGLRLQAGRYAQIEVEDTGKGIAEALRERIFEPYFTTKTAGPLKGTGLGLATVFGIVQSHGGWVGIARSSGEGTTMRVLLPLGAEEPETSAPTRRKLAHGVTGRGTLLVIDDEPLVLRITTRALEELGYRVIAAPDGATAIERLRGDETRVDAVVLDLVMPVMGGRQTFLGLRELAPELPVLLVTGYGLNNEVQELLDLGVRDFIGKPFSLAELSAGVARVLQGARQA
jgi:two-component system, cell cycle sensor histidine kinase and response regulator CckA